MLPQLLTLNVTYSEAASFPSVAPLLIYDAETKEVKSYSGVGTAPSKATIELFKEEGFDTVPDLHIWAQLLPASPDMIIRLLQEHGTMSFSEIVEPAITLATEGFPVHSMMLNNLDFSLIERIGMSFLLPYNADVYLDGQWWRPLHHGDRFRLPDLAKTFEELSEVEKQALNSGKSREESLQAVRDYFYKGEIADKIADFHQKENGLITKEDLANYEGKWEDPLTGTFHEYTIFSNQTWNQGGVVSLTLQILEDIDLKAMGHNSPEYTHTVLQAIELAMADREAYFADPDFVDVPIEGLFSKEYAASRRNMLTPGKAYGEMPDYGDPYSYQEKITTRFEPKLDLEENKNHKETINVGKDTSSITIIDKDGNAVALTPSDFPQSPMIPDTGLNLGIRMTQFRLDENHINKLEPGKRPRITPNPIMLYKDDEFYMTMSTPGGDIQAQAMIQVILNHVVFGMDIQEAIEAPRFRSYNWPDSFAPHEYNPGTIELEQPLYDELKEDMEAMGYSVREKEHWGPQFGGVVAIIKDPTTGKLIGGADPREESWAIGK